MLNNNPLYPAAKSKSQCPVRITTPLTIINRDAFELAQRLCRMGDVANWNRAMFILTGVYSIPDEYFEAFN